MFDPWFMIHSAGLTTARAARAVSGEGLRAKSASQCKGERKMDTNCNTTDVAAYQV
jgi:hypothetical protein